MLQRQLFDGGEIFGEEPRRIGRFERRRPFERENVGHDAVGKLRRARAFARCGGAIAFGRSVQPRDVAQQRAEGRRRCRHEVGNRARYAAGFDEPLAQVHEMTLDLRLARAPQITAIDRRSVKWIRSEEHVVCAQDFGVLEREGIE